MNDLPLVSVIMIFLNAQKFIVEAIDSVIGQTYSHWELLLVDDGSTDESTTIARRYADKYPSKVRYLEHEGHRNRDMPASRNLGMKRSNGEYIAFLDADDVWLPHKLEQQVAILQEHPEAALVYGLDQHWYSWTGDSNDLQRDYFQSLGVQVNTLIHPPLMVGLFLEAKAAVPCPTGILVKRSAADRVGGFEEIFRGAYNIYEDQAFYAKLLLRETVFASNKWWDRYRRHAESSCAIAKQTGETEAARIFFLRWLSAYLHAQRVTDPEIWDPLRRELFRSQHPKLYSLMKGGQYRMEQVKARWEKFFLSSS